MPKQKQQFKIFMGKGKGKSNWQPMDSILFNIILVLLCYGLIMCFSASAPSAQQNFGNSYYFFQKQLLMAVVGLVIMIIVSKIDYHKIAGWLPILIAITIVLLIAVLFFPAQKGGHRWIFVGPISVQPSELAKFVAILWFARLLSQQKWHKATTSTFFKLYVSEYLKYLLIIVIFAALLMLEPHFSCTLLITGTCMIMLLVGGSNIGHTIITGLAGVPVLLVLALKGYRGDRIQSWLDPFANQQGDGWQIIQSLYAIGSGGLFGLGLGQSRQKFLWLPEPYNDFIFAVLCEELGFIGALSVIVLFAVLIWRGFMVSRQAPDKLGSYLAFGITTLISLQVLINIAVVTSLIPVTGMPLPFFSSGGTALLFTMGEMGVLLNISRQADGAEIKQKKNTHL